jgi:SAM-dependent methyltransferase
MAIGKPQTKEGAVDAPSRFFKQDDPSVKKVDDFILPIPWWSRPFEYAWATSFVKPDETVLDAGCGVEHPFKWYLGRRAKAYACDTNPMVRYIAIPDDVEFLNIAVDSIASLYYQDEFFDTVFCLSVLEHLPKAEIKKAISEFKRVLKPGGKLVLTIDVPTATPEEIVNLLTLNDFEVEADFTMPENPVQNGDLLCFRILATKKAGE